MGCYGWYLEFCKQNYWTTTNHSDSNIVPKRKQTRKKWLFKFKWSKVINENINFNNSNTAIKDKNNRQKYKHEIKNIEREKNNSLNSDSEEQQKIDKKRNVNRHHIEPDIGQKIASKHNNRAVATAIFGGITGVISEISGDKNSTNNYLNNNNYNKDFHKYNNINDNNFQKDFDFSNKYYYNNNDNNFLRKDYNIYNEKNDFNILNNDKIDYNNILDNRIYNKDNFKDRLNNGKFNNFIDDDKNQFRQNKKLINKVNYYFDSNDYNNIENQLYGRKLQDNYGQNMFNELDLNMNKLLDKNEIMNGFNLSQNQAEQFIAKYDLNGDGQLDQNEFNQFL